MKKEKNRDNNVIRVPKNTYPVHTEHARQFGLLHVQRIPRLVAGVLHCTRQFTYIEAVVAQELKHSLPASLHVAKRVWCAVEAQKKIFRDQGGLRVLFGKALIVLSL